MSDTPRTDAAYTASTGAGIYELFQESKDIERELNAANAIIRQQQLLDEENLRLQERIKRLEEMYEGEIGENEQFLGSNLQGLLTRELNWSKDRIKRLEEGGDEAICALEYASRVRIWTEAKEAKP
jgi:hypothetical protein